MTMPQPEGTPRIIQPGIEAEMRQLRSELEAVRARPLRFAGDFFTQSDEGVRTFSTGPYYSAPEPDGSPQWITQIRDKDGQARIVFWDPNPSSGGYVQAEWHWDHLGQIVWTTDNNGGWAEPHLPVVLYPRITPPDLTAGNSWDYMWVSAASAAAEDVIWAGTIGYVSHTRLWLRGTWGGVDGGTGEYKLKVNGITVATWTQAALSNDTRGPFPYAGTGLAATIGQREADIELTVRRSAGAGRIACQVSHCHQRQT